MHFELFLPSELPTQLSIFMSACCGIETSLEKKFDFAILNFREITQEFEVLVAPFLSLSSYIIDDTIFFISH